MPPGRALFFFAEFFHRANGARRISRNDHVSFRETLGHNASRSDDRTVSQLHAGQNYAVHSDKAGIPDLNPPEIVRCVKVALYHGIIVSVPP